MESSKQSLFPDEEADTQAAEVLAAVAMST